MLGQGSRRRGLSHGTLRRELSNCIRFAEEGMDGPHLLLEFVEVGSRDRNMSCLAPAAKKCLGYIYLGPAGMADWADEAGRIVKALHRLVLCRAKSPHVTTTTEVMWTGVVKFFSHRVRGAEGWRSVFIGVAAGIPFRRRGHD